MILVSLGIEMSGKNVGHQCPAANSMFGGIVIDERLTGEFLGMPRRFNLLYHQCMPA